MKMRRRVIAIIASTILLATTLTVTIYSWYTNIYRTGIIKGTTNDIILNYQLNGGDYNVNTYDINGLTFFDESEKSEGKYLPTMAYSINLKLTNLSAMILDLSVYQVGPGLKYNTYNENYFYYTATTNASTNKTTYTLATIITTSHYYKLNNEGEYKAVEADHKYKSSNTYFSITTNEETTEEEATQLTNPVMFTTNGTLYVKEKKNDESYLQIKTAYTNCVISENELAESDFANKSISDYKNGQDLSKLEIKPLKNGETNLYIYVYGVQTDKTATNDFLNETYSFSFAIDAVMHEA